MPVCQYEVDSIVSVWFSRWWEVGLRTPGWEFSIAECIWLERSVFCATRCLGIMRIMPSSLSLYLDVIDSGYIEFVVWMIDLNFVLYRLENDETALFWDVSWWLRWTKEYSGTTVLNWLTLMMSNRTLVCRRTLYNIRWVKHFVLEELCDYFWHLYSVTALASWLFNSRLDENQCIWELLEVFRCFWPLGEFVNL